LSRVFYWVQRGEGIGLMGKSHREVFFPGPFSRGVEERVWVVVPGRLPGGGGPPGWEEYSLQPHKRILRKHQEKKKPPRVRPQKKSARLTNGTLHLKKLGKEGLKIRKPSKYPRRNKDVRHGEDESNRKASTGNNRGGFREFGKKRKPGEAVKFSGGGVAKAQKKGAKATEREGGKYQPRALMEKKVGVNYSPFVIKSFKESKFHNQREKSSHSNYPLRGFFFVGEKMFGGG